MCPVYHLYTTNVGLNNDESVPNRHAGKLAIVENICEIIARDISNTYENGNSDKEYFNAMVQHNIENQVMYEFEHFDYDEIIDEIGFDKKCFYVIDFEEPRSIITCTMKDGKYSTDYNFATELIEAYSDLKHVTKENSVGDRLLKTLKP